MTSLALVLSTVNAPYSQQLDAQTLVHCLIDQAAAQAVPGQMSSFSGEVGPALQVDLAHQFNISGGQLTVAAKAFAMYSGESYPLAASAPHALSRIGRAIGNARGRRAGAAVGSNLPN